MAPGQYCGFTQQGPGLCITVGANGREIEKFLTRSLVDCTPGNFRQDWTVTLTSKPPIAADRSFTYTYSGPGGSSGEFLNIQFDESVRGQFATDGTAQGTLALEPDLVRLPRHAIHVHAGPGAMVCEASVT